MIGIMQHFLSTGKIRGNGSGRHWYNLLWWTRGDYYLRFLQTTTGDPLKKHSTCWRVVSAIIRRVTHQRREGKILFLVITDDFVLGEGVRLLCVFGWFLCERVP